MPSLIAKRIKNPTQSPQTTTDATPESAGPSRQTGSVPSSASLPALAACPACCCPALWLDPYGRWHCGCCEPPRSLAQVRGEILLRDDAAGQPYWHDVAADSPAGRPEPSRQTVAAQAAFPPDLSPEFAAQLSRLRFDERTGNMVAADHRPTPYCWQPDETFDEFWARGQRQTAALMALEERGGVAGLNRRGAAASAAKPARPPAGAILYWLTEDRSVVCGQDRRGKAKKPPDDIVAFTWEGAAAWVPVEPTVKEEVP